MFYSMTRGVWESPGGHCARVCGGTDYSRGESSGNPSLISFEKSGIPVSQIRWTQASVIRHTAPDLKPTNKRVGHRGGSLLTQERDNASIISMRQTRPQRPQHDLACETCCFSSACMTDREGCFRTCRGAESVRCAANFEHRL